ncbi:MAG: VOC family protein [Clostridiaceae bacterium]|nr:VOC family protein [Clostridiaceae bacterium]
MEINIAILLNGKAWEAVCFYEKVFGVKAKDVIYYGGENTRGGRSYPNMQICGSGKIRLATLCVGNAKLRIIDFPEDTAGFPSEKLAPVIIDTAENISEYYKKLLQDCREITVPITKTPFAELHAAVTDKFGITWLLNGGYIFE